ncbi:MAG: maleylpyruvate isomerase N-terminal domain-containing protein [Bacteroidota bacterium]
MTLHPGLQPLHWLDTSDLFLPLHELLIHQLETLDESDWEQPTVAGDWRVRDVAAHLLDGDLRVLSFLRDGHNHPPTEPIRNYRELVGFLNRLNAEWVTASKRLSPHVLLDLLRVTGPDVARTFAALPPHDPAPFSVDWAGESASENWMHVGREYTERWHHQMQIRDAVGVPLLLDGKWLAPLLDLSMRALPHAYRQVDADAGVDVSFVVTGDHGGVWSLVRGESSWRLFVGQGPAPSATLRLDPDTVWRSFYHALTPSEARTRAHISGDDTLVAPFFAARSVMV